MRKVLWQWRFAIFFGLLLFVGFSSFNKAFSAPPQPQKGTIQNLGPQVFSAYTSAVNVGIANADPVLYDPVVYAVVRGQPAQFNVVDVKTGEMLKSLTVQNAFDSTSGAATVAPDGTVYIGTRRNGHMYQYVPGSDKLTDLGQPVSDQSVVFRLVNGKNGVIYGSTYPGGHFFKYDPATKKFTDYGQAAAGERYGRSIAYDPGANRLFIGTGVDAKLIEYRLDTREKVDITNIIPNKEHASKIYDMKVVSGHLFLD